MFIHYIDRNAVGQQYTDFVRSAGDQAQLSTADGLDWSQGHESGKHVNIILVVASISPHMMEEYAACLEVEARAWHKALLSYY